MYFDQQTLENHQKCIFLHEPLVHMMKKVVFYDFQAYFIVFDHVNLFTGRNTQHKIILNINKHMNFSLNAPAYCPNLPFGAG